MRASLGLGEAALEVLRSFMARAMGAATPDTLPEDWTP